MEDELKNLKFGEEMWVGIIGIKKTFGGYIYMFHDATTDIITSSVFVPYNK